MYVYTIPHTLSLMCVHTEKHMNTRNILMYVHTRILTIIHINPITEAHGYTKAYTLFYKETHTELYTPTHK